MRISRLNKRIMAVMIALVMVFSLSVTEVNAASSNSIKLQNYNTPTTVNIGHAFNIKGTIKAGKKIYKVEIGIVDANGKWLYKYTKTKVNSKSFNIKKADYKLKFGKLKAGKYYYRINVQLKGAKNKNVLNKAFNVVDNRAEAVAVGPPDASGITLTDCNAPGTYMVGKEFQPKGIVTSDSKINKVEVGIVFAATNKWTSYKYTAGLSSYTFDLSRVATALKFEELPAGKYRYRMYAHTDAGIKIVFNKEFTVTSSGKPQQAVEWAIRIANDDSFTYGEKPYANQQGCYFCGNNDRKVQQSGGDERYYKTYVCLTFIGAAYAHGAGDPEILKACQKRKMTMYETNDNFSKFSCWMKIGSCKELTVDDLLPGDVIIKWSDHNDNTGHVCMYIGNNNLVEASGGTFSAKSISVKYGAAASRLKSLGSNSKNYVMRYRH
ncbi:MAG: hypothetical protein IJH92_06010 [Mogibacterium sp.]|nr:hypothetical protein [Mogibacterium sp.]